MRPRALHVVGAAILRDGRCLVARRGPGMHMAGKWELPGGKVEAGEAPWQALARELREELGIEVAVGDRLGWGEVIVDGRALALEAFTAAVTGGRPELREHTDLRWIDGETLGRLDWPDLDVPILPALQARLRVDPDAQRCARAPVIVSADWSRASRKRAACVAEPGDTWSIRRAEPPGDGWTFAGLLDLAEGLRARYGRPVLVGIDAALGLPALFARRAGLASFPEALARLAANGGLYEESERAEAWSPERPFFRVPKGRGSLSRFVAAAGGRSALLRQVELRSGAKPVFAVSGIPGTVGSGSRALWRELTALGAAARAALRIWPFDGSLRELTGAENLVLAEAYPRVAYGTAVAETLPARPLAVAKTRREARAAHLERLQAAPWVHALPLALPDLAAARESEDEFDALVTAAALVRLVSREAALADDLVDPRIEGGILGTGETEVHPGRREAR